MAVAKIITGQDIIVGLAVANTGANVPIIYVPPERTERYATVADMGSTVTTINSRFLYHGGPGGSGNWEH